MACVSELGGNSIGVAPVDGGLGGAGKEVSRVSREGDGGAGTHDLSLSLNLHHLVADLDLGNGTISSTCKKVAVSEQLHAVDALREQSVGWADSLEESALQVNLNDVTSESSHEGTGVIGSDNDALVDSLDRAHGEILEQDFLLGVVDVPDADAIVMDGHQLLVCVVEEGDFVSDVHANSMSTDGFSTVCLFLKEKEVTIDR